VSRVGRAQRRARRQQDVNDWFSNRHFAWHCFVARLARTVTFYCEPRSRLRPIAFVFRWTVLRLTLVRFSLVDSGVSDR